MKSIITSYLEKISSKVFEDYHPEITKLVGKHHGVYALYKKNRLYYVGLATNLRSRVKHHLKDRHSNKWDHFSIYLIHHEEHLRELEALILHIAEPKGNKQRGKLLRSRNFINELRNMMIERNNARVISILGGKTKAIKNKRNDKKNVNKFQLHDLLPIGTNLFSKYKGVENVATIEENGKIKIQNKYFNSPSLSAYLITQRPTNGWTFWKYRDSNGRLVFIDTLRKVRKS